MNIRRYSSNGLRSGLVAVLAGGLLFCSTAHAQLATTTTLSVSPNAPQFGQPVTLTATVTPNSASGTVLFLDGVTPVAAAAVNPSGQAQATTILLPAGRNFMQAVYSGSPGSYQPSQSATLPYIVTPVWGGGFANAVNYPSGRFAYSVAVGDFNGDGKADLVVANANSGNVSVLLGNGNGTLQAPVAYLVGSFPAFVVVGDFNGDGKADLAVANYSSNNVSVLLGNGDGTFQPAVN